MADSRRRTEEAATEIGEYLDPSMGGANPRGAYAILKHLVSARVCAGAQTLPGIYVEGQGGLPYPLSEGGATQPCPAPGNTRQPIQGERKYPIGCGRGGSGTPPTPTQGGRTHPPLHGKIQTVATGGLPRGKV